MARYVKGQSGNPQGRPKGAINKRHAFIQDYAFSMMGEANFCPLRRLIELAQSSTDENIQLSASRELAQYIAPKLRSLNLTGEAEQPVSFRLNLGESPQSLPENASNSEKNATCSESEPLTVAQKIEKIKTIKSTLKPTVAADALNTHRDAQATRTVETLKHRTEASNAPRA